jgi:hypothetical protein
MTHFVSASCKGETCGMCNRDFFSARNDPQAPRAWLEARDSGIPATHKVGEEIMPDDPFYIRHNLTQYVCCEHFQKIMGITCDPVLKAGTHDTRRSL